MTEKTVKVCIKCAAEMIASNVVQGFSDENQSVTMTFDQWMELHGRIDAEICAAFGVPEEHEEHEPGTALQ